MLQVAPLWKKKERQVVQCFHGDVKESGPFLPGFQPRLLIRLEERQVEGPQRDSWSPQQQPGGVPAEAFLFPPVYLTFPSLPFSTPTFLLFNFSGYIFYSHPSPFICILTPFFFGCRSSSHILSILFVSSGF